MKHIYRRFILSAVLVFPVVISAGAQELAGDNASSLQNDSLVQVAFRKVSQNNLLGGASVVNVEELTKKNYNTWSLTDMQGYVGGYNGNSLWGMDEKLILVDGVPRNIDYISPTEISQITFLKGAQAVVLYGSRAAKGVIMITTKRGKSTDLQVDVRANTGFYVAKSYPEYLGSAEYMTLYNEARANDGLGALYSAEDIYHYGSGENPYRYANVNMYSSDYIKKAYNRSDVTAEISGGNHRAHFYTNINYLRSNDVFKIGEAKHNGTNGLNIRGNVDLTLNDFITAYVNAKVSFYSRRSANGSYYWSAASTLRPNRISPLIPLSYIDANAASAWDLVANSNNIVDGKYFLAGTQSDMTNVFGDYYASGYSKATDRSFQFDAGVNIGLDKVLKGAFVNGASAAGEYAYDANGNLTKDLNKGITDIQYNVLNLPSTVSFSDGSTITYTYGADGTKLRTVHKIGSTTTTTDYCGNVIYENGTQKLLLTEEGYINLTGTQQYHYYLKDHQGNNRVVINQSGTVEETNHYYPFGGVFGTTGNTQPYKYNGKEFDTKKGLNWYDYGARHYDAALGRFTTNDPLAEKYYSMSPYTYCADNPVKFIDPNGMEYAPGDLFKTKRAAAKDWGMYYNGASIIRKREMGSSIYEVKQKGKLKGYSYSAANEGEHSVSISLPPNGERFVGSIHSHGDADAEHINNKFSKADIKYIEKTKENGYLATPSGDLLEYNPYSKKTSIVTSDLPNDPKDPKRKNNINPKDIPAEKGKQRMKELLQKPDLNIPVSQREHIHWVF